MHVDTYMENQQIILLKVKDLFFKYGVKSITMDDIANHLGMSKKTIYQFYADKNQLIESVLDHQIENDKCICSSLLTTNLNAVEIFFELMVNAFKKLGQINPALLFDLEKYHRPIFDKLMLFKHQFIREQVLHILNRGIEEGVFEKDFDIKVVAAMHLKHVDLIISGELFNPLEQPIKVSLLTLMRVFIRGIATPKGMEHFNLLLQKYEL